MNLPAELQRIQLRIRDIAKSHGLDCFETIFEMLDAEGINEVAAYGGFPTRFPHWRHGMEYDRLSRGYRYGLHKIYELVINNDPCFAYLLSSNSLVDNKLVIAHVYGHCDFFKNNAWFAGTDRRMMDGMANHATHVRRLIDRYGQEPIEELIDRALSLENLLDLHALGRPEQRPLASPGYLSEPEAEDIDLDFRMRSKDYMEEFINPPEYLAARRRQRLERDRSDRKLPGGRRRDVVGFLLEAAPLERPEREILEIVHAEALYFAPQRMTKIMNEGWASYWHRKIMIEDVLVDEEIVDYADVVSGTLAEGESLNPYKLGLELYLDIEERWNTGRHGLEYERCDDQARLAAWDTKDMKGKDEIFFARRVHSDITFVDTYLTEEFCHRNRLFVYRWNPRTKRRELATRDFAAVKDQLLRQLTNGGSPVIEIVDPNWNGRGELYLEHRFDGQALRADWAAATLNTVAKFWKRPAHLATRRDDTQFLLSSDGTKTEELRVDQGAPERGE